MRKLEIRFHADPLQPAPAVGTLLEEAGRIYFQYAQSWLDTGLNLSPFKLPFDREAFQHQDRAFGPLPGLFDDSLPDGWGRLLIDRHFRAAGLQPAAVSPLDRLAWLGTRTMGALTYHPCTGPEGEPSQTFDLEQMARQARDILAGRTRQVLPELLKAGGSPGGACPKVLVGFNPRGDALRSGEEELPAGFEHWLVKFPAEADEPLTGAKEFAYSRMARAAGLEMPETHLFETEGGRYFGIKRFDRAENRRFHVHTFGNLIQTNFRIPSCDYGDLLKVTALLTGDHREVLKAWRRMAFNVLAHNRDDHAKNFAFILDPTSGTWALSPAYDLSFSHGPGGEHSMTVAGEGRNPGPGEMLRLAGQHAISRTEAARILEEVRAAASRWPGFAAEAGVPKGKIDRIDL